MLIPHASQQGDFCNLCQRNRSVRACLLVVCRDERKPLRELGRTYTLNVDAKSCGTEVEHITTCVPPFFVLVASPAAALVTAALRPSQDWICMYIYKPICLSIYLSICLPIYLHVRRHMIYIYITICICTYISVCTYIYIYICIDTYSCVLIYIYICMYHAYENCCGVYFDAY